MKIIYAVFEMVQRWLDWTTWIFWRIWTVAAFTELLSVPAVAIWWFGFDGAEGGKFILWVAIGSFCIVLMPYVCQGSYPVHVSNTDQLADAVAQKLDERRYK